MRSTAAALALLGAVAPGCSGDPPAAAAAGPAQFTIRGRWRDPARITYRIEAEHSPIGAAAFTRAVARAAGIWNATGAVTLLPAAPDAPADVTLGWRAGHHGACPPFGPSTEVAHTGPTAPGTFVHFDRGRTWTEHGPDGISAVHTALHELGHVLGLGHSEAPEAVMSTSPARPLALSAHDLAGLHSLYGGGLADPADLRIAHGDAVVATLRQVAPRASCAFAVFDSDGDGDQELLVWRTDTAGHGALVAYHFGPGPQLVRTVGPCHGAVAPAAQVAFVTGPGGERLLVCTFDNGQRVVRQFDHNGVPGLPAAAAADDVLARAAAHATGDLDGDGRIERVLPD